MNASNSDLISISLSYSCLWANSEKDDEGAKNPNQNRSSKAMCMGHDTHQQQRHTQCECVHCHDKGVMSVGRHWESH